MLHKSVFPQALMTITDFGYRYVLVTLVSI